MKPSASTSESIGTNVHLCAILLAQLNRLGIAHAVLSPGSRSTPIAVALADGPLSVTVCLDERTAGFYALGLAKRTGQPVLVVTTSGTASVELIPALAEASLSGVALCLLTADRPARLKGVGAPQTLDQVGPMAPYVGTTVALELDTLTANDLAAIALQVVTALIATPTGPGPVHVNIGIEEPLLGAPIAIVDDQPVPRRHPPTPTRLAPLAPERIREIFDASRPGLLLVGGRGQHRGECDAMARLATHLGWDLAVDARTSLGTGTLIHFDLLARTALPLPDVAVVIGDFPLSRPAMGVLGSIASAGGEVIALDDSGRYRDPGRNITGSYAVDIAATLRRALTITPKAGEQSATSLLAQLDARVDSVIADAVLAEPASEIAVTRRLYGLLGGADALFTSASMPIRYLDQFRGYHDDPPLVMMNRGANGIDGVIATYLGFAHGTDQGLPALLIGDLATLYDASALLHLPMPSRGLIVVLDNQGGLIFDTVPPAAKIPDSIQTEFFRTPPRRRAAEVLRGLGMQVSALDSATSLDALVEEAREGKFQIAVLEGTRASSADWLSSLYAAIDAALVEEDERL